LHTLGAIRENPFCAEALGYRTVIYRTLANCIAVAAGALNALWLRYTRHRVQQQHAVAFGS